MAKQKNKLPLEDFRAGETVQGARWASCTVPDTGLKVWSKVSTTGRRTFTVSPFPTIAGGEVDWSAVAPDLEAAFASLESRPELAYEEPEPKANKAAKGKAAKGKGKADTSPSELLAAFTAFMQSQSDG